MFGGFILVDFFPDIRSDILGYYVKGKTGTQQPQQLLHRGINTKLCISLAGLSLIVEEFNRYTLATPQTQNNHFNHKAVVTYAVDGDYKVYQGSNV